MGIAVILVVLIAGLVGLVMMPTVFDIAVASDLGIISTSPLYDIVNIIPYVFGGLIILGCIWAVTKL